MENIDLAFQELHPSDVMHINGGCFDAYALGLALNIALQNAIAAATAVI
jgi:hypothetical protein